MEFLRAAGIPARDCKKGLIDPGHPERSHKDIDLDTGHPYGFGKRGSKRDLIPSHLFKCLGNLIPKKGFLREFLGNPYFEYNDSP